MKILLIEDNETFASMLCTALREAGHEAESALSGAEGIKKALSFLPELILLDYQLGDMTGYDVAAAMKHMTATSAIPFMVLSSLSEDPLLTGAFRKMPNCRGILLKTTPLSNILAAIGSLAR